MAELYANTGLSHYRFVSRIGAGSMGEVYLAQDTNSSATAVSRWLPALLLRRLRDFSCKASSTTGNQGWQISDETAMFSKARIDDLTQPDLPRASFISYLTALETKTDKSMGAI